MNPRGTVSWQKPTSLTQWEGMASTKLDVITKIVNHHLETDNAPPLKVGPDGQSLELGQSEMVDEGEQDCDRIVIFSAFLSSNAAIRDVRSISLAYCFLYLDHCLDLGVGFVWHPDGRVEWKDASKQTQACPQCLQVLNSHCWSPSAYPVHGRRSWS